MSDLTITCERCKAQVDHRCNAELMPAIVELFTWTPEIDILDRKSPFYAKGDEDAPFMSEAVLYNLLGKSDARTLLALVNHVIAAAGIDDLGVHRAVNEAWVKVEERRKEQRKSAARSTLIHQIRAKGGMWVPEEQWPLLEHLSKYPERWQVGGPVNRKGVNKKKFTPIDEKKKKAGKT